MAKKDNKNNQEPQRYGDPLGIPELVKANKLAEDFNLSQQETVKILEDVKNGIIKTNRELDERILKADAERQKALVQKKIDEERLSIQSDLTKTLSIQKQRTKDLVDDFASMSDLSEKQAKAKLEEIQAQRKDLKERMAGRNLTEDQQKIYHDILKNLEEQEGVLTNLSKLQGNKQAQALAGAFEQANDAADEMQKSVDSFFDAIPGGGMLSKVFGADKFADQVKGQVAASFSAMNQQIAAGGSLMGALKTGMAGFNKIVLANPLLLLVAAGAALYKILSKNEEAAQQMADATGQSFVQSKNLVESMRMRQTIYNEELATTKEILAVQTETISKFGAAGELSAEVASNVAETGMAFGYGAQEAGKVQTALMGLGASGEAAAKAQEKLAADAFKAGVNVSAVMKDISENSKKAQRYMGGNLEAITDAAVEAAKLGLSLGDLAGMADGLLDIEGSITAQYEFQAMTGKQINIDKARQLALEGDLEGMAKAISEEAGTLAEFNEMNVFQKEKMAKAFGMEVDQMADMLAMEDARLKHGKTNADLAAELGISAEKMANMSDEQLKAEMARAQSSQNLSKMMSDIGDTLMSIILPVAEAFGQVLTVIMGVVKYLLYPFRMIANWLGQAGVAGNVVLGVLKGMAAAYLTYIAYQKISGMLRARRQKKEDAMKKAAVEKAEIEAKYNAIVVQGNDATKTAVTQAQEVTEQKQAQADLEEKITEEKQEQNDLTKEQIKQADKQKKGLMGRMKDKAGGLLGKGKGLLKKGYDKIGGMKGVMGGAALLGGGYAAYQSMGGAGGGGEEVPPEQQTKWGMPSFDTGGTVASTGVAKVHAGEQITPASKVPGSEPKGDDSGGGGMSIDYDKLGAAVAMALAQNPPVVHLDGKKMSNEMAGEQSYNRGVY